MADADGLDEAAEQILRVGLTAAAQLAERLAQARTQSQRAAAARSDREAGDLAGRIETERRAADAQRILDQVRAGHGPDAVPPGPDPAADLTRGGGADSPARRAARADAALLLAAPDVDARVQSWLAEHPGPLPGLTPTQSAEAVDARLRAALFQAAPAGDATTARTPGAEKARTAIPVFDLTRTAEVERG